LVDREKRQAER
jgi:hypothetical protein